MTQIELNRDFRDVLVALVDARADFLLIGGWALAVHGHVRGTDDLDIFVRATPENGGRVFAALREFGAPLAAHGVTEQVFSRPGQGYRMGIKPNLIELLTTIDGVSFEEAWEDHIELDIDGRAVPTMGRGALLKNKTASGRPKDLADVEWLTKSEP